MYLCTRVWCGRLLLCCSWEGLILCSFILQLSSLLLSLMAPPHIEICKIISWIVRGLNSELKRALLFLYLKLHNPQIVLLQETHLMGSKLVSLKKPWIQRAHHSSYSSFARGGLHIYWEISSVCCCTIHMDPQGKFVMGVLMLLGVQYVIVAIYFPPPFSMDVLMVVLERISIILPSQITNHGWF